MKKERKTFSVTKRIVDPKHAALQCYATWNDSHVNWEIKLINWALMRLIHATFFPSNARRAPKVLGTLHFSSKRCTQLDSKVGARKQVNSSFGRSLHWTSSSSLMWLTGGKSQRTRAHTYVSSSSSSDRSLASRAAGVKIWLWFTRKIHACALTAPPAAAGIWLSCYDPIAAAAAAVRCTISQNYNFAKFKNEHVFSD